MSLAGGFAGCKVFLPDVLVSDGNYFAQVHGYIGAAKGNGAGLLKASLGRPLVLRVNFRSDVLPPQLFGGYRRRAAAAKGVNYDVAGSVAIRISRSTRCTGSWQGWSAMRLLAWRTR